MIILLLVALTITGCTQNNRAPLAVKGQLDLSSWNLTEKGPVSLSGEWEYYNHKLLGPNDFSGGASTAGPDFVLVPGLWRGKTAEGEPMSALGYGTYRLQVNFTENQTETLTLLATGVISVCKIWVDGSLVASTGLVGTDRSLEKPVHHFVLADFSPSNSKSEIIIQVSNFHNTLGGINNAIRLGDKNRIHNIFRTRWISSAFTGGALLVISLYHLALFLMRRSVLSNLYLSLFCFFWFVSLVFGSSCGFIVDTFGLGLPWVWHVNLALLPFGLTIPLMLMFYHSLFPKKYGWAIDTIYSVLGALLIAYILVTPSNAYDPVVLGYFLVTRTAYLYLLAGFILDIIHREKGISLLAPGYIALACSELDDILFDLNMIGAPDLSQYGILIFVLCYSLFMSARFTRAFISVDNLSTELEAANKRLVQLNKLKDTFLANTTHELKTPLAGMVGIAETLLTGGGGRLTSSVREQLLILLHSGKRLSGLVNDVLDLSRLEHHDIILHTEPVSLYSSAAERVRALSRQLATSKRITLNNEIPPDFPPVAADRDRLEQILINLVGNSLKFTDKGHVTISARFGDAWAEVAVQDTGIGIPPEDFERIFEAYAQVDSDETHATGGTGLGLAITRHLVQLHGGQTLVQSEPGEGSTFGFTLPLFKGPETEKARGSRLGLGHIVVGAADIEIPDPGYSYQVEGSVSGGRYQVLVVDDEPVNLYVVGGCLRLAGISFRAVNNGAAALRVMEEGDQPEMLLLDIMMPGLDGYEVCRRVREKHSASALPVIMLTVKNRTEDIVEGFAAGANDYLTKPFSSEELAARVTTQLKLKAAYDILTENLELKKELSLRRQTEHGLRLMQIRLSKMLDSLDEAIIAVNQSREISFCNQAFIKIAGFTAENLLGRPLATLLARPSDPEAQDLTGALFSGEVWSDRASVFENIALAQSAEKSIDTTFFVTGIEVEDEPLLLMVVRPGATEGGGQAALLSASMLRELNNNRQRILNLEEAMLSLESGNVYDQQSVMDDLKALDMLLERMSGRIAAHKLTGDKRDLAVKVMNLAVSCWASATGATRADLAEQSRLWNVYVEKDGYCRTQTLDKYLSPETLPERPRWRNILATVEFVLASAKPDMPAHRELAEAAAALKALL